jgi:hypothetical protein
MLDNSKLGQSDISITIRRSYGNSEPPSLLPQLDNFSVSNISVEVEFLQEDSTKALNFLKSFILLMLICRLPVEALDEAVQTLEQIREFYSDYSSEIQSTTTSKVVAGKIVSTETRHPTRDKIIAYKYPIKSKVKLEAEFNSLAEEWRAETGMLSLVTQKSMHPAYQKIIGMGQPVVPLILRDLEQKPDHWFWALRAITGDNPVKSEQRGRMKMMAQAWIEWGKEHGYEW